MSERKLEPADFLKAIEGIGAPVEAVEAGSLKEQGAKHELT